MSFEDIQKVTAAEQGAREQKSDAQAEARQIVANARKSGTAAVEKARADAQAAVKTLMDEAEARAQAKTSQTLAENAAACDAMRQKAETRLDEAADLIVRRVVKL